MKPYTYFSYCRGQTHDCNSVVSSLFNLVSIPEAAMNYHGGPGHGQGMMPHQYSNGATHYNQGFPPQGMHMNMHQHGMMPPQHQAPQQQMGVPIPPPPSSESAHPGGPESEYKHQSSVLAEQSGVSTTAFDSVEELLWIGTNAVSGSYWYCLNIFYKFVRGLLIPSVRLV